jgi:hypothetical protein
MQKLSIIKFKPKPGCLDEFAANLSAYNETKHRVFHLMKSGEELHAIVIRDANILAQDACRGRYVPGQSATSSTGVRFRKQAYNPVKWRFSIHHREIIASLRIP